MVAVLNIITALGIDSSLWVQLIIFIGTFLMLKQIVFAPYFAAYEARQGQTKGYQDKAEEVFAQTRELEMHYQRKARGLAAEIKAIYASAKQQVTTEQEKIQMTAEQNAKKMLELSRTQLLEEFNRVRDELSKQAPEIGQAITAQLISTRAPLKERN